MGMIIVVAICPFASPIRHCLFTGLGETATVIDRLLEGLWLAIAVVAALCLGACAPSPIMVQNPTTAGAKGETFGYRKWISEKHEPEVVVIGIHGFCGASIDYNNFGQHLLSTNRPPRYMPMKSAAKAATRFSRAAVTSATRVTGTATFLPSPASCASATRMPKSFGLAKAWAR